jgi:hypothetical protein
MRAAAAAVTTAAAAVVAALSTLLAAFAALAALPLAPATPAAAARPLKSAGTTITRSAHVGFENCNAQHVTLSVTIPSHAFAPNEPVTVAVRLRNTGGATCGTPLAKHVPAPEAHQALTVGPCGALPLIVRSTHGRTVYPGPAVFFCPEESGFQLAPHSTAKATATWSQTAYVSTGTGRGTGTAAKPQQAPPGPYRVTVDGVVTAPVTLVSG